MRPVPGYYQLTLKADSMSNVQYIIHSNSERAFIVAVLQDTLRHQTTSPLATHIDLLAFSITRSEISLVLFAITHVDVRNIAAIIINRLHSFQQDIHTYKPQLATIKSSLSRLAGPRTALHQTTLLHANHLDWEYDRYSSIGFYLHERRGDWMHLWRLSGLYKNNSETYRRLVLATIERKTYVPRAISA